MIASLRGQYRGKLGDAIIVDAAGVGYEVVLPPVVEQELGGLAEGQELFLHIAYVASRDQPAPVLYGFTRPEEKEFWGLLRSVPRVGPRQACRAMVLPVNRIAQAIAERNTNLVDSLPGISAQGAEKIVATLRNKVSQFVHDDEIRPAAAPSLGAEELKRMAVDLLVDMGIRRADAVRDVDKLLDSNPGLQKVEDVVMEYFRK
ncbi:MAG: Holliday junction branch migration protein RuvA [Chloroflexota bacterium]